MNLCFLLIGSNLGNREENLKKAIKAIKEDIGIITGKSSVYETEPWGFDHAIHFLNQVIICSTYLDVSEILSIILSIEENMGRKRSSTEYTAREIDIDILFFNSDVITRPGLIVPHPRLHLRNFVLIPLAEIAPDYMHPVMGKTTNELLKDCPDTSMVKKFK
jgi:2-amino-4-hydroxy-6-hydroxymethyldihydropteridine diphosphokinase